jgi:hypothetical protein
MLTCMLCCAMLCRTVQALLRDPARLQSLLERNPHLMTLLKTRLGM